MYLSSKDTFFRHHHLKNILAFISPDYAANAKGICSGRAAPRGCTSNGLAVGLLWEQAQSRARRQRWGVFVASSPPLQGRWWWALQGGETHGRSQLGSHTWTLVRRRSAGRIQCRPRVEEKQFEGPSGGGRSYKVFGNWNLGLFLSWKGDDSDAAKMPLKVRQGWGKASGLWSRVGPAGC